MKATSSPEIALLREAIPEFEEVFQVEVQADEEVGAFEAVSLLATWVCERLQTSSGEDAVRRAFEVVERLIAERRFQLGDALAAEFIEVTWNCAGAERFWGPRTRERYRRSQ